MSEYLFKRLVRGTFTLSKDKRALSTPLRPIRWPISLIVTPKSQIFTMVFCSMKIYGIFLGRDSFDLKKNAAKDDLTCDSLKPGRVGPATPSRTWQRMAWTPCHSSPTFNWAKTTQCWAWSAPFVIQYLWLNSVGELIVIVSSSLL